MQAKSGRLGCEIGRIQDFHMYAHVNRINE